MEPDSQLGHSEGVGREKNEGKPIEEVVTPDPRPAGEVRND